MKRHETKRDYEVFKELYHGLTERYKLFCEKKTQVGTRPLSYNNLDFEERYIGDNKLPKLLIIKWNTDFVNIDYDEMSLGLTSLVKMEADLLKLERGSK